MLNFIMVSQHLKDLNLGGLFPETLRKHLMLRIVQGFLFTRVLQMFIFYLYKFLGKIIFEKRGHG
jgi:hypothetical protein